MLITRLLMVLEVWDGKPTYRKSWAGILLVWSELTFGPLLLGQMRTAKLKSAYNSLFFFFFFFFFFLKFSLFFFFFFFFYLQYTFYSPFFHISAKESGRARVANPPSDLFTSAVYCKDNKVNIFAILYTFK